MVFLSTVKKRNEIELDNISMAMSEAPLEARKKIKYGNKLEAVWGVFAEYCQHSSVHGFQYLGDSRRNLIEKIFWICIYCFSIYGCLSLIGTIWDRWQKNPVIVSFNEKSTPVWQIPFPAVTICPERKFSSDVFNYTDILLAIKDDRNLTLEEQSYLNTFAQVCDYAAMEYIIQDKIEFQNCGKTLNASEFILDLDKMYESGWNNLDYFWENVEHKQNRDFRKILTEEGICFTFNLVDPIHLFREEALHKEFYQDKLFQTSVNSSLDWNLEDGYNLDAYLNAIPRRALSSGTKSGLQIWLYNINEFYDKLCRGPIQGHKILLHTPNEIGDLSNQYIQVPTNQQILVAVKPKIITTSERLKSYSPQARQCFFQNERYLRFFKVYTQKNCDLECIANYTLKECGCVKFDMPRNIETPVCGLRNLKCYVNVEMQLYRAEFEQGYKTSNMHRRGKTECNCLPACTTITYDTEVTQADYNLSMHFDVIFQEIPEHVRSVLEGTRLFVYFKEDQFLTSKRSELYGTTDFLANCGGLLGLFMGVSLLSFVELIYFFSIRLISNLKMRHKRIRKLKSEENY